MKFSWKDIMTTLLALAGAAVVYAKFYDYSWALIGSWRGAVSVLALIGLAMFAFSSFDFSNLSILNLGEMVFGLAAVALAIVGMIMTSSFTFYTLAMVLGALWLVDTARDVRRSLAHADVTSFHHHAPVH